ncbi:MAG: glutamate--tRNA ligase [Sphingomonas sp.]|nr:glutamate--tRNA ligase [Sphingomonas sp.]
MSRPVRVRIAPSPTGEPHVGTLYTALINEAFARRHGGKFILRIEDTDQSRSTPDSEAKIMEAFSWMGLEWDEGPDKGGPHAPYRQSERKAIYGKYADKLLADGNAFRCFCSAERLESVRAAQRKANIPPQYDGHCLTLPPAEAERRVAEGEPHVLRMKVPRHGSCDFTDGVYGAVSMPWASIDMQVLVKSDGMPTYHLANVVDDTEMEISHVIRGEEWMASTPKHILLYTYLGLTPPDFIHLPLMRALDRSKLSKRRNPTSTSWFQAQGYLPEAMVNFLGLLFVRPAEGEEEIMTKAEFIERFDIGSVSKAGAVFDLAKLDWLNGRWLRERLAPEDFLARVIGWANAEGKFEAGLESARTRIDKFADLPGLMGFLFTAGVSVTREDFPTEKLTEAQVAQILAATFALVEKLPEWSEAALFDAVKAMSVELGLKARDTTPVLFVAITGSRRSLPLFGSMALLGRSVCRERLRAAVRLFEAVAEVPEDETDSEPGI